MTREKMASFVAGVVLDDTNMTGAELSTAYANIEAAAAELRKVCATCVFWEQDQFCSHDEAPTDMPADGSGFCHRWEAKP